MIERVAGRLIEKFTIRKTLSDYMKEWYRYVLVGMIEKILGMFVIALTGLAIRRLLEVFVYYCFVRELRQWTGGYHCKRLGQCLMLSASVTIIAIAGENIFRGYPWVIVLGILFSVIIITMIGTVNHINMDLTLNELKRLKRRARCVMVVEALVAFAFMAVGYEQYVPYMVSAMLTCAASMIVAKMLKQEVKK